MLAVAVGAVACCHLYGRNQRYGIPTPFPEPESPELRRFALRVVSRISGRLRSLQEAAVRLSAFVDAGGRFRVVTLLKVDEKAGKLILAGPAADDLRGRLAAASLVTLVEFDDAGKVQFAPALGESESNELTAPIAEQVFSPRRRNGARSRLSGPTPAVCKIRLPRQVGERE
ncbi:MAG: flagellar brake protein [Burkholderiales bacterium]|nr:MAG: flagellar brake protein [Burkholderiales bacterium]